MKKTILVFLIFLISFPAIGRDKVPVIGFTGGGYSLLPETDYMIGYMNKNGSVNWKKLNRLLQRISNEGSWGWREFPPWPTPDPEFKNLAPFQVKNGKAGWNRLYFENLIKIFRFAWEQYRLVPIFDLFNASETRVKPAKLYSSWNAYSDYFYKPDSMMTRHYWINRVIAAAGEIPVIFQLCNEPPTKAVDMMIDTYIFLIRKDIHPSRIIIGWDVFKKKKNKGDREAYNKWRDTVTVKLKGMEKFKGINIGQIIKGESWSPIHGMTHAAVQEYFNHGLKPGQDVPYGSSRNTKYSTDAVKPRLDFFGGYNLTKKIITVKPKAIMTNRIEIELTIGKETNVKDPFGQLKGGVAAITEKYGPPKNKGKYPKPLPIPKWVYETIDIDDPVEPKKPEKSITITKPIKGEIWKSGGIHTIAWKTTGTVGNIKIEYSIDNEISWTIITPDTPNYGFYPWEVPGLPPGSCVIKVSEVDGDQADTQTVTIEGTAKESEKKKTETWWLWAIIAAVAIFLFYKHTVITALVLAGVLLFVSYFGYRKKWKYYYTFLIAGYVLFFAAGIITYSHLITKVLFSISMIVIVILSLIVDKQHKKIKFNKFRIKQYHKQDPEKAFHGEMKSF